MLLLTDVLEYGNSLLQNTMEKPNHMDKD